MFEQLFIRIAIGSTCWEDSNNEGYVIYTYMSEVENILIKWLRANFKVRLPATKIWKVQNIYRYVHVVVQFYPKYFNTHHNFIPV